MSEASAAAGEDHADKELIATLLRSRLFRDYETVFTRATGLPLALRPREFWQLAHRGKKHENAFCALLAENPKTLAVCLQAHDEMIRHTGILPHTVTCPFGLTETAVPVKLGERVIGYLRIGQVLRHSAGKSDTSKVTRTLREQGLPFSGELRSAWQLNPLMSPDKYNAIVRLLNFFAEQLSALANQIVLENQNAEPPLVQKARAFIAANKKEALSLAQVANAAGASIFHFCKVFKKTTGLKFTDYLARVRLEDARHQLLNPNKRVSEVAYDVGFQSLTQFNRMFKRVFGQSPSEFRDQMHAQGRAKRATRTAGSAR
jgi:AraC-like DNA-binding protein/ligand-binding sensor protein